MSNDYKIHALTVPVKNEGFWRQFFNSHLYIVLYVHHPKVEGKGRINGDRRETWLGVDESVGLLPEDGGCTNREASTRWRPSSTHLVNCCLPSISVLHLKPLPNTIYTHDFRFKISFLIDSVFTCALPKALEEAVLLKFLHLPACLQQRNGVEDCNVSVWAWLIEVKILIYGLLNAHICFHICRLSLYNQTL